MVGKLSINGIRKEKNKLPTNKLGKMGWVKKWVGISVKSRPPIEKSYRNEKVVDSKNVSTHFFV